MSGCLYYMDYVTVPGADFCTTLASIFSTFAIVSCDTPATLASSSLVLACADFCTTSPRPPCDCRSFAFSAITGFSQATAHPKLRKITYICRGRYRETYQGVFQVWGGGCSIFIFEKNATFLYTLEKALHYASCLHLKALF